jgi:23S rRNA A2030 N6-methylase RlmJ
VAQSGLVWVEPPEKLARNIAAYGQKVLAAVHAVADFVAGKMQNESRQNAPWTDRTGNARSGLFSVVTQQAAEALVTVYLSHGHTIDYGKFLELAHGQRYAIVMPTIQANLPALKQMLDDLFR